MISHEKEATRKLMARVKYMLKNLPVPARTEYDSKDQITFPDTNSSFYIGTAGSKAFGRGDTITHLHASEFAFWPNADTLWTGLIEAVIPDGLVFIESTANGIGNPFHDQWTDSSSEYSEFAQWFFPWYIFPDYTAQVPAEDPLSEDEIRIIAEGLKNGIEVNRYQLQWRRNKLGVGPGQIPSEKKLARFNQEYPSDPVSCFQQTGRPVFESRYLFIGCKERLLPEYNKQYVIGADCAEGKEGGDYSTAYVIDKVTAQQVYSIHGNWKPDEFGRKLYELGETFNWAELGVERNNHGHAVILTLDNLQYPNIYTHEDGSYGWLTTGKNKPIMVDQGEQAIRHGWVQISDQKLLDEMLVFKYNEKGSAEAAAGKHDDRVMAFLIAWQLRNAPTARGFTNKPNGF